MAHRSGVRSAFGMLAAALLVAGCVSAGATSAAPASAPAGDVAAAQRLQAAADAWQQAWARSALSQASAKVAVARELLAASDGSTLDDVAVTALAQRIDDLAELATEIRGEFAQSSARGAESGGGRWATASVVLIGSATSAAASAAVSERSSVERFGELRSRSASASADLDAAIAEVRAAIAAWRAEQTRIAEEAARVAAEQAARAAAEQAEWAEQPEDSNQPGGEVQAAEVQAAEASPAGPVVDHVEYVAASGRQAEIDACMGSIVLSPHWYPVASIGEHWSCGGSAFPTWAGAAVLVEGAFGGLYRVEGIAAVLDLAVDDTGDIPGGYDLLYQTCLGGDTASMAFVAMTRIG